MTGSDDRDARPTTRRRMLMRLGLAATAVYAAPTLLQLSHAQAQAQVGTSRSLPSFTRPSYSAPSFSRPRAGVRGTGHGGGDHGDGGHGRRRGGWVRGRDGARPWQDRLNPFRR